MKQKFRLLLTFLLILTLLPITAFAETGGGSPFTDVSSNNWALQHITKMEKRGVITGYGNGEFQPDKPVSQLEAVVMAVRAMGLEDEAKGINTSIVDEWNLNLPNSWEADSYVAMAISKGLIEKGNFNPDQPASRSWTAVLIIKMIGATDEVKLTPQTKFYDDHLILPQAKGYVDLATDKGIITGYYNKDGKLVFDPNSSVTRAQLATMISKSDIYMQDVDGQLAIGKISVKNGQLITITNQNNETITYTLANNVLIFDKDGKRATTNHLQSNLVIRYSLNNSQNIDYIELVDEQQWKWQESQKGTITQIYSVDNLITIKDENGKFAAYKYLDNVKITNRVSAQLKITDLKLGDNIFYTVNSENIITRIELAENATTGKIEGTIYSIDAVTGIITVLKNSQYLVYPLADQVYIEYEGVRFPTINNLQKGDLVQLEITDEQIQVIKVIKPLNTESFEGKLVAISGDNKIITIKLDNGALKAFELSDSADIIIKGDDIALIDDLKIDDRVNITVEDGLITSLEVMDREILSEVSGTIKSIDIINRYITIETKSKELVVYRVDPYTKVDYDNSLYDLSVGMDITASLNDGTIYAISTDTTVEGTFVEIDSSESFITIRTENNKKESFRLDSDVDVNIEDVSRPDLSDIKAGQKIILELNDNLVTTIDAETTKSYLLTDVNTTRKRITVDKNGVDKTYSLSDYTEIIIPDIKKPTISDFNEGDTVMLTFTGNYLTSVEVLLPVYGKIKSLESFRKQLIITTYSEDTVINLPKTTTVYNSSNIKMSLDNLKTGDYIKLVQLEDEIIITQAEKVNGKLVTISGTDGRIYIESSQGSYKFYDLSNNVMIWSGSSKYYLGDLKTGSNVTLYLFDNLVIAIEIK